MFDDTRNRIIEVAGGAHLRTRTQGRPSAPAMLFLHGGGGSLEDFDAVARLFDDHYRVAIDARGHGGSTLGTLSLRYPLLADDAEAVLAAYNLANVVVVGHSDGAIAALHLAARGCERISAIVTISADAEPPGEQTQALYRSMTSDNWRTKFPDGVTLYEQLNPEPDFDRFFAALREMWLTAEGNFPGASVVNIDCRALVLGGDADHLVPRTVTVALAEVVKGAALGIVPQGTHALHQEVPTLVVELIRRFLEAHCEGAMA